MMQIRSCNIDRPERDGSSKKSIPRSWVIVPRDEPFGLTSLCRDPEGRRNEAPKAYLRGEESISRSYMSIVQLSGSDLLLSFDVVPTQVPIFVEVDGGVNLLDDVICLVPEQM